MKSSTLLLLGRSKRFAPIVHALFGNGEQGLFIVPSYTKSLFQDAAMTIPAAVGMPVVKALDLSGRGNTVTFTDVTLQQDDAGNKYLAANGASSSGLTSSVDLTGTDKMFVCAGVHKASDAVGYGVVAEFGLRATPGSFSIHAPAAGGTATYMAALEGAASSGSYTAEGLAAPATNVVSAAFDIGGAALADEIKFRINGVLNTSNPNSTAGTGNFGNHPFYLMARGNGTVFLNGRIYGFLARAASCTAGQIDDAERYMARLTGVSF